MSLFVEIYSEKAIVLRGAQEQHRNILEANKGMFNARLKGGSGWIFPKYMKAQIEALVQQIESGVDLGPPAKAATASSSSAEPEVSKKEYLALVSRVERLEALVEQLTRGASFPVELKQSVSSTYSGSSPSQVSSSSHAPLLDSIPVEDLELDFEEEDDQPKKKLSRPKIVPTVESIAQPKRQTFSKPKVNQ